MSEDITREHNELFGDRYPISVSCCDDYVHPAKVDVDILADQMERLRREPIVDFLPYLDRQQLKRFYHDPDRFMVKRPQCLASWYFLQILADGNATVYTRCHTEPLGNINEESFYEIWGGARMAQWRSFIRKQEVMPMCKRCDLAY